MKSTFLVPFSALVIASACFSGSVFAGEDVVPLERYEREERGVYREYVPVYRRQPRTVTIIVRERPVQHIVYGAPVGGYYRIDPCPKLIVRDPCYAPVPSRYFAGGHHARIGTRIRY